MTIARKALHANRIGHWQFSMRKLLLLVLVAGPMIGLGGPPLHRIALETMWPAPPPALIIELEPDCILWDTFDSDDLGGDVAD